MKNKFYIDYKEIIDLSSIGLKPKFNFVFDIGSYIEVDLNKMTYFHTVSISMENHRKYIFNLQSVPYGTL